MKVKVGISNRHVHLNREDLNILFGNNYELTVKSNINQPGQFASMEVVTLKTLKSTIENVRILGPVRDYTQVEISQTDAYKLGINPPLRDSGDLIDSEEVTIIGPKGQITKKCCILVRRHIHITNENKINNNIPDIVSVKVNSPRGGVINNVFVKASKESYYEMHIDTDEANALMLKNDDEVEIIF